MTRLKRICPNLAMTVLDVDAAGPEDVRPANASMTIRQVLSHSAGLSYGFIEPESVIDKAYIAAGINQGQPIRAT